MKKMILFLIALALPGLAFSYIGPGAGIGAIGTVISLLVALLLLIVGFVWYPLKRLLRKRSAKKKELMQKNSD